ncbi:MAG: sensor histidine kinase [Limisphaerales bacterium]
MLISIEDDGKGFSTENGVSFGNGLRNMKQRMENIGGTFSISTAPGKGTRIDLEVQINKTLARK